MPNPYFALIPAAGSGSRMGADIPKQYLPLLEKTVIEHTVAAFLNSPQIAGIWLVVSKGDEWIAQLYPQPPEKLHIAYCGGASRAESVNNGLLAMRPHLGDDDWVLVHDAARPGLTPALIAHLIESLEDEKVGGLLALPVVDTVKRSHPAANGLPSVQQTEARQHLWLAQTPQMFRYHLLQQALAGKAEDPGITDEASAIEAQGWSPRLVVGHPCNAKVTVAADLAIAEMYLRAAHAENRN
ncbi:MAG: 2-C-methyl-D-erythritol 4-phosphate cytidylyltransferase [Burkholderiales bacterium]|nr:2-C-methyl-D-erythritol 4-phosphate cytidylyltransferase [Burkholderiales bacterium]